MPNGAETIGNVLPTRRQAFGVCLAASAVALAACSWGGDKSPESSNSDQSPSTTELEIDLISGLDEEGVEQDFHIAGEGSCSPYTQQDAIDAQAGELTVEADLLEAEAQFLRQNPDFAKNFALTAMPRTGYLYEALELPEPTEDTATEAIVSVFENEYYVTAPLAENTEVINTFCDDQGNVHFYRRVWMEAGTHVGGMIVESEKPNADGSTDLVLASGVELTVPKNALLADVMVLDKDGDKKIRGRMLATNKAGIDLDGDGVADIACINVINAPEGPPPVTTTTDTTIPETTTSLKITTTTRRPTTSTTDRVTTTSQPTTTTTRRDRDRDRDRPRSTTTSTTRVEEETEAPTPVQGRGDGDNSEPDNDNNPDNNTTTSSTSTTEAPSRDEEETTTTTSTTMAQTNPSTTSTSTPQGECGPACE